MYCQNHVKGMMKRMGRAKDLKGGNLGRCLYNMNRWPGLADTACLSVYYVRIMKRFSVATAVTLNRLCN